jgi:Na+-translocating ferredoxin:NAD+ oxidoreductase RnfA subunit
MNILILKFIGLQPFAGVAQSVEQLICNQPVAGSSPIASSRVFSVFSCQLAD